MKSKISEVETLRVLPESSLPRGSMTAWFFATGILVLLPAIALGQGTLFVEGDRVGIGTESPGSQFHIFGAANQDVFSAMGPNPSTNALNFGYSGASFGQASGFFNVRPGPGASAPNPALYFMTGNVDRMIIDNEGFLGVHLDNSFGPGFNPTHPIHAKTSGAFLSAAGVWTNASSRDLKENIRPLDLEAALAALEALEPIEFNYKIQRGDPQVGFIAEDVPQLVATPDRKTLAPGEIVGVLTRVVQEQQRMLEELSRKVSELTQDLEAKREEL